MEDKLLPGTTLQDKRYIIKQFVASGGMSNIYRAQDQALNNIVCLKIMHKEQADDNDAVRRFNREYEMIAEIQHQNVLDIMGRFNFQNTKCLVTEFVEGVTLKHQILNYAPLQLAVVHNIFNQICEGLKVIHQHQIIHRDIKPENILITYDGNVKISDFGVSIKNNPLKKTMPEVIIGTTKYMAPEAILKQQINYNYDVYALGVLVYECLVGYPPFSRFNSKWIATQQVKEEPFNLEQLQPTLKPALINVVAKSLLKNPRERYQDIESFQSAFNAAYQSNQKESITKFKQHIYIWNKKQTRLLKRTMSDRYRFFPYFLNLKFIISSSIIIMAIVLFSFVAMYWV